MTKKAVYIVAALIICTSSTTHAQSMSDSLLSEHDEEVYTVQVCDPAGVTSEQCTCMVRHTLGLMDAADVHIALVVREGMSLGDEGQSLIDEGNKLAGSEEAAMAVDDRFAQHNDEALSVCIQ